jgi:hypothetical protein
MLIERINSKDKFGREIIFISVSKIDEFDFKSLPQISKYFTLFIANNNEVDVGEYSRKANSLIKSGLAYICAWGNGCERIHDIFDEENVYIEIEEKLTTDDENVIMTTWHQNEFIEEALYFFLFNTSPTEKYSSECKTALVLLIGISEETNKIKMYLENQDLLE